MRLPVFIALCTALVACNGESNQDDTDDTDDTDVEPEGFPSSFESGQYRVSALSLNELGDGEDQNGDEIPDNNLPNALTLVDLAIADQDFSLIGFNTLISDSIEARILNVLISANHQDLKLDLNVVSGNYDEESEEYEVDPGSFDADGNPISAFAGHFETEVDFGVSAEQAVLPVTFIAEDGPLPVPLTQAKIMGLLEAETVSGQISGAIPADDMVNNVIAPMIPEEGASGMTREEIMELVQNLTTNETLMDVPMPDGTRGISAAFRFEGASQMFDPNGEE